MLTGYVSIRDLTVGNSGGDEYIAAILATQEITQTWLADLKAHAFILGVTTGVAAIAQEASTGY